MGRLPHRAAPALSKLTAEQAAGKLTAIMEELGFSPEPEERDGAGEYRLRLLHCPFREVAQHHQDVICALHLGLMRGACPVAPRSPPTGWTRSSIPACASRTCPMHGYFSLLCV